MAFALAGSMGCDDFRSCPTVADATLEILPSTLSATGLYADISTRTLSTDVMAFTPRFPLWSDGADKTRWLALPEGGTIDATDMHSWRFPEGTRAWKEFAVNDAAAETRMIEKFGPGDADWAAVAYRWDGDDATAVRDGAVDAGGTTHDIPTAEECVACHGGRASFVLGFSAVQLAGVEGVNLDTLAADGRLSSAPGAVSAPGADEPSLGYLHANCSHCHNAERASGDIGVGCYDPGVDLDWTLPATELASVKDSPAFKTGENALSPGHASQSEVIQRMSGRNTSNLWPSMPPLGTEVVDDDGVALISAWIDGL